MRKTGIIASSLPAGKPQLLPAGLLMQGSAAQVLQAGHFVALAPPNIWSLTAVLDFLARRDDDSKI